MAELKPCPFCGEEAIVSWNTVYGFCPWCSNPNCILNDLVHGYDTEKKATKAWNRRNKA